MTAALPEHSLLNPAPWYSAMRQHSPVLRDPRSGLWMVFMYGDVQRVLSDWKTFSSQQGRPRGENAQSALASSVISTDPPRHRQLRSLVEQAFTPRQVRALEPRIAELVDELLSTVQGTGRMDFIRDFAYPLPVIVIAEILGIPASDRAAFKRWSDAVVTGDPSGSRDMAAYFGNLVRERTHEPGEDLISGLIAAQVDGEHLDPQELLGFCMLLLVAGNETTTNLLANTVLCWQDAPEAYAACRRPHPADHHDRGIPEVPLPGAVHVPQLRAGRGTQRAGHPGRQSRPRVDRSANRDETQFEHADHFDPARSPNRHLAFGHGVHFCLGAPLARLEASVALNAVLDRLPDLQVQPEVQLDPIPSQIVSGVRALPVQFGMARR